jgi:hypothetical protein
LKCITKLSNIVPALRTSTGQTKRCTFVVLLRKSIPQKHNTWPAVYSTVMWVQEEKLKRFGKYAKAKA